MSCQCFMWLGHIFCRKGILDPKKRPVVDVIDFAAMSDTDDLPLAAASPTTGQPKSGSTSFKAWSVRSWQNVKAKRFGFAHLLSGATLARMRIRGR